MVANDKHKNINTKIDASDIPSNCLVPFVRDKSD